MRLTSDFWFCCALLVAGAVGNVAEHFVESEDVIEAVTILFSVGVGGIIGYVAGYRGATAAGERADANR